MKHIKSRLTLLYVLSISAGLIYSSWPLGHWLNPIVSKSSLASGLEAIGQPYNWLFIGLDVLSSLLVITICIMIWQNNSKNKLQKIVNRILIFTGLFAIGTIIDALISLNCIQGTENCPNFTNDHVLLVHGIFSILASIFLFLGVISIWLYKKNYYVLNIFLAGYIVFGLISLIEAIFPGKNGNWSQDYYITLCSAWIAALPFVINKLFNEENQKST